VGRNHFRGRKSNFSVTVLKKTSNQGVINEPLCKLRGLVILAASVSADGRIGGSPDSQNTERPPNVTHSNFRK
jgi:hypothetical protein